MRWVIGIAVAIIVLVLIYLGSAASSLSKLVAAAQAGDGKTVIELTDVPALGRSLTNQIITAYLERIGTTRRIGAMEKMLINTYGATIADAMVAKLLTADKLTQILKTGNLSGTSDAPNLAGLPALADLHAENWASLLGRVSMVQPALLAIRVSKTSDPDSYAAVNLHYQDFGWKLSGIVLPKAAVRELAASLPVK
jgi:hypothetical protein